MSSPRRPSSGNSKRGDRSELITHSGLRFVGSAAALVSDQYGVTLDATLRPEDVLYAAQLEVRPRSASGDAVGVLLAVLGDALGRAGHGDAHIGRGGPVAESSDRFRGFHWDTFASGDSWTGELTWIHPHPALGGVPLTTHVLLVERGARVSATIHVGARGGTAGVYGLVAAGQARPAFLAEMKRLTRLTFEGASPEPHILDDLEVFGFVRDRLLSKTRRQPIAVLAPLEPKDPLDPVEYLVPPAEIAEELMGLAPLYLLARHPTTFRLTDTLGDRRLSCYWGALRVYMPGFSTADDPMRHPLLTRDRVEDPVVRAGVLGQLGVEAGRRIRMPEGVLALREEAARRASEHVPAQILSEAATSPRLTQGATETERTELDVQPPKSTPAQPNDAGLMLGPLRDSLSELTTRMAELVRLNTALLDEVASLRTATAVRAANSAGVERRLAQFERLLREHIAAGLQFGGAGAGTVELEEAAVRAEEPADVTLVSVVQHAESEYADALLILESAIAAAAESPYQDVPRVATYLKAMADLARRRQQGRLKASLREAFQEAGIDYRGGIAETTPKRLRQQYLARLPGGRAVECLEHFVLGSSYDPKHCLRIYFTTRAPGEPRFVITHVGRHFDVISTT